jgi:hypothetical protein
MKRKLPLDIIGLAIGAIMAVAWIAWDAKRHERIPACIGGFGTGIYEER